MGHDTQHITDLRVFRLHVAATARAVVFAWDYPGSTLLLVRIQRSEREFAREPDQGAVRAERVAWDRPTDGQLIVYEGVTGSFRDGSVAPGGSYFYTVWARPLDRDGAADGRARQLAAIHVAERAEAGLAEGAAVVGWTLWARKNVRVRGVSRVRLALARVLGRV
jgi:hypothetical protein